MHEDQADMITSYDPQPQVKHQPRVVDAFNRGAWANRQGCTREWKSWYGQEAGDRPKWEAGWDWQEARTCDNWAKLNWPAESHTIHPIPTPTH